MISARGFRGTGGAVVHARSLLIGMLSMVIFIVSLAACSTPPGSSPIFSEGGALAADKRRFDEAAGRWLVSFTPRDDSVLLAFMFRKWEGPWAPEEFLLKGKKARVDRRLSEKISLEKGRENVWDVLGQGLYVPDYQVTYGAAFYRDRKGIRLIALEGPHFASDTIILSSESKHPARLVKGDFAGLRTNSGITLGTSAQRLRKLLGAPSARHSFREYEILWFLQKPTHQPSLGPGHPPYKQGYAAAYALKRKKVVEIWLHLWSTERSG